MLKRALKSPLFWTGELMQVTAIILAFQDSLRAGISLVFVWAGIKCIGLGLISEDD